MKKNSAAVALGRKGGLKGGAVRAARLTPEERSASARAAVSARWAKAGKPLPAIPSIEQQALDTSDRALTMLLKRLRTTTDLAEIRRLSDQIERVVFNKQFRNA